MIVDGAQEQNHGLFKKKHIRQIVRLRDRTLFSVGKCGRRCNPGIEMWHWMQDGLE